MIMMLVIKSSGTCSWTQVSSSAESIRWKSCESSRVICSATWQVNFLLLVTWTLLLELHILWVAVLIFGLCDTTSTDLKLSKLWRRGVRLKLPDLWMWNQFSQWKRCWRSQIKSQLWGHIHKNHDQGWWTHISKSGSSRVRRSSYLRMNWDLTECCFYLSQNSQLLTRQTSKPEPIPSFHAWSSWWWTQSTSREGFCSRSPPSLSF